LVNAIDQKDNYTYGHSERVGFLAKVTGQSLGLTSKELQKLEWAGLLHDVGKIGIPEHVLNKPGRLTPEEFDLIKEHPGRSYEVLRPVASLEPVLDAVLYHHENPDGTGYPKGLKGEEIPLMARIIHVVDVFDALTSTRSYRGAYDVERAIEIISKDSGTKLDAQIVECFFGAWAILPKSHPEQYRRWFGAAKEMPT
jgi:HD-GYP domain-containing protein (c-di-GMP phosphodiesterase class II)